MNTKDRVRLFAEHAKNIRRGIVESVYAAGSGHPGGALGVTDILTVLYFYELSISPENPTDADRDRFILSAAHMVPGLYSTLAERGFFPVEELTTLRQFGSRLQGHTFLNNDIGVETTGGSLGQGLSISVGLALAARMDSKTYRTYCLIGDGESNEGQIWEAAMLAAKENLGNLCVILDANGIQLSDDTENIMPMEPMADKWQAFGWNVLQIDGHDYGQIVFALEKAKLVSARPTIIIANTIAGKGVSFMEDNWIWHGKAPNEKEYKQALLELE